MSSLYLAVLSPPSLPLHRPPPAADPAVTTSTASSASGLPTAPPSAVPSARPSPRPPVSPPSPGPHSQPQSQGHAHLHPPTSDEIDAVIQMATSARPSPDGRPVPLKDTRTQLFVGNLPYRVRWQDLKDLFRKAGTVLRADVSLGPDNRSRGYGTVLLATAEDAGRAVDMFNGYSWQTRVLEVRLDRLPPDLDNPPGSGFTGSATAATLANASLGSIMANSNAAAGVAGAMHGIAGMGSGNGFGNGFGVAGILAVGYGAPLGSVQGSSGYQTPASATFRFGGGPPPPQMSSQPQSQPQSQSQPQLQQPSSQRQQSLSPVARAGEYEYEYEYDYGVDYGADYGSAYLERPGTGSGMGIGIGMGVGGFGLGGLGGAMSRNLFVGNLPFHCQWQDLKDLFRQAGTILRADVALGQDGRSRGFGTVVFATDTDAERAVQMFNGYEYNGRPLKVHFDKYSPSTQPTTVTVASFGPNAQRLAVPVPMSMPPSFASPLAQAYARGPPSPASATATSPLPLPSGPGPGPGSPLAFEAFAQGLVKGQFDHGQGAGDRLSSPVNAQLHQQQQQLPVSPNRTGSGEDNWAHAQSAFHQQQQQQQQQRQQQQQQQQHHQSELRQHHPHRPPPLPLVQTLTRPVSEKTRVHARSPLELHQARSQPAPQTQPQAPSTPRHANAHPYARSHHAHNQMHPHAHSQQHPAHPGPISLPPPHVHGFPLPPVHSLSPSSPYPLAHYPLGFPHTPNGPHSPALPSPSRAPLLPMPLPSPLHAPAMQAAHAHALSMTPHGLPPITPSMPSFSFVPAHAAFSPGLTMSPGAFWGRPGGGGNPFINAAVGAPVRGEQGAPGQGQAQAYGRGPARGEDESDEQGAREGDGYFPPVPREDSYFSYVPASGSRLANEILRSGERAGAAVGVGMSASGESEASGSGGKSAAGSAGEGVVGDAWREGEGDREGVNGVLERMRGVDIGDDVFWNGWANGQGGAGAGAGAGREAAQRAQSVSAHTSPPPPPPVQIHRTGSDPAQHTMKEKEKEKETGSRPTTSSGGAGAGAWTGIGGTGERRASFAEVVSDGGGGQSAAAGALGRRAALGLGAVGLVGLR